MTSLTDDPLDLDRLLRDLAGSAPVPPLTTGDDLARGRRRVRRRRALAGAAAGLAAAVIGAGALVVDLGPGTTADLPVAVSPTVATDSAPGPTEPPVPPEPVVDTRDAKQLLTDWRDVVARYLDPRDQHLERVPTGLQGSGPRGIGTKLGWSNPGEDGLGVVQIHVSPSWRSQFSLSCDRFQDCRDVRVDGIAAKVLDEGDGDLSVGVQHPEGFVVVVSVAALFGNNSLVPVSGIDVTVDDLVRAAADDRFSLATREQVAGAYDAFGFPGVPGTP